MVGILSDYTKVIHITTEIINVKFVVSLLKMNTVLEVVRENKMERVSGVEPDPDSRKESVRRYT